MSRRSRGHFDEVLQGNPCTGGDVDTALQAASGVDIRYPSESLVFASEIRLGRLPKSRIHDRTDDMEPEVKSYVRKNDIHARVGRIYPYYGQSHSLEPLEGVTERIKSSLREKALGAGAWYRHSRYEKSRRLLGRVREGAQGLDDMPGVTGNLLGQAPGRGELGEIPPLESV